MATNNVVDVPLSGNTGTGNFVGANTPTLITPVLGASTATSINFGGSTLSTYIANTSFTPTITFNTPGNLSVSYALQTGHYVRIGSLVWATIVLEFTPTYTTASGDFFITGLPVAASVTANDYGVLTWNTNVTWPTGSTSAFSQTSSGGTSLFVQATGSTVGVLPFTTTQLPTGVQQIVATTIVYSA